MHVRKCTDRLAHACLWGVSVELSTLLTIHALHVLVWMLLAECTHCLFTWKFNHDGFSVYIYIELPTPLLTKQLLTNAVFTDIPLPGLLVSGQTIHQYWRHRCHGL